MENETVSALQILQLFAEVGGLSTFIFAATAQVKQFGVGGKALTSVAFAIGIVFGGAYRYFVYNPVSPLDYFWLVTFGLVGGFIATGAYNGAKSAAGKDITVHVPNNSISVSDAVIDSLRRQSE